MITQTQKFIIKAIFLILFICYCEATYASTPISDHQPDVDPCLEKEVCKDRPSPSDDDINIFETNS